MSKNQDDEKIECEICKSYIPYEKRPFHEKISANGRDIKARIVLLVNIFKDYGVGKIDEYLTNHKKWAKNAKECVKKYEHLKSSNVEHTIIIVNNDEKNLIGIEKNQSTYASGIDLLIEYFVREAIKFKVVICYDKNGFINAIKNSEGDNLWISGHGWRHGVDFGNNKECPFCEFSRFEYKKNLLPNYIAVIQKAKLFGNTYLTDRVFFQRDTVTLFRIETM